MGYFWEGKDKNYTKDEVTDSHLLNIINFIANGKGYLHFLNHKVIHDIYDEAIIRGLKPNYTRSNLLNSYDERLSDYEYEFEMQIISELEHEFWHGQD